MKVNDWVLCPLTEDDTENPTIVAQVDSIEDNIINIRLTDGTVSIPKSYCRVVHIQGIK